MTPNSIELTNCAIHADSNRNVLITCGYRANGLGRHIERLAELLHAPILTSFDGKGTVDESHPLSFGGKLLFMGIYMGS